MAKDEDFKLLKIQTCTLRVNLHCDGCKHQVKKVLQRIEGDFHLKKQIFFDKFMQNKIWFSSEVMHGKIIFQSSNL
ncbi:putative heavy metal-associated domain, HMA, heavy metal-associated domain superfamily [Helianthus annuus]|nr:putative heavy metal-associated domain, HMA, heavy metal-associated domain superfamily [Helianthus annuus]